MLQDILYPQIEPYKTGFLKVSEIHTLYYEEVGNPEGQPVVFLHGGPGGGLSQDYRRYFNPKKYRVILFDQRGAGQSAPSAELRENTTWDLVQDIETLREHCQVKKWVVFGGSWGSTLALSYAIKHPNSITALVLRGIFLCRKKEIQWFYQEGASKIYPEAWQDYLKPIPESEREDLVSAYYKRLTSEDSTLRLAAAKAWSVWEASTSNLLPNAHQIQNFAEDDELSLAFARIECHYFINKIFYEQENLIFDEIPHIQHIPTYVVHGRYDVVCPVENAFELKQQWPEINLTIVPDAGHSIKEVGIAKKLVEIMDHL